MTDMPLKEPTDFSLVQGGPLFQLWLRGRMVGPSMDLLSRRMITIAAIAWAPLLILTLLSGSAIGGSDLPFYHDLGAHVRLLVCMPLLVAAEVFVHRRIKAAVQQFLERGIIAPEDQPRFEIAVASAMRLRNSRFAEIAMLGFVIVSALALGRRYISLDVASWFATPASPGSGGRAQLTPAGYWYFFVSLAIFRFLLLRWYFRLFVWYRFLWQVSRRIPLQLNALHPDRAGGLGFLSGSVFAFQPLMVAHTAALAGIIGGKIWNEGAALPQFKMEIALWMFALILLVVTPLFFFITHLTAAKRAGSRQYGIVGSRYVAEFRRKWIEGQATKDETLIGTADIQSLADLANSFEVVSDMKIIPLSRASIVRLGIAALLPLTPLLLTMFPLEKLVDRALSVFM